MLVRPLVGWSVPISLRKLIMSQFLRAWDLVIPLFDNDSHILSKKSCVFLNFSFGFNGLPFLNHLSWNVEIGLIFSVFPNYFNFVKFGFSTHVSKSHFLFREGVTVRRNNFRNLSKCLFQRPFLLTVCQKEGTILFTWSMWTYSVLRLKNHTVYGDCFQAWYCHSHIDIGLRVSF